MSRILKSFFPFAPLSGVFQVFLPGLLLARLVPFIDTGFCGREEREWHPAQTDNTKNFSRL
jgi:hypothetical protein